MSEEKFKTSDYQASFFIVPMRILSLPNLTLAYLKVYETIFQFWNHGKDCFLSDIKIMERTGLSERSVRDAFIFFEKHNELERRKKGRRYFMQIVTTKPCINNNPTGTPLPVDRHSSAGTTGTPLPHNKKKVNNKKLSKSFYKDKVQKENKEKHDFAPMKNEAMEIKKNNQSKCALLPGNLKDNVNIKRIPKEKDNKQNQEALKIMAEKLNKPLNSWGK